MEFARLRRTKIIRLGTIRGANGDISAALFEGPDHLQRSRNNCKSVQKRFRRIFCQRSSAWRVSHFEFCSEIVSANNRIIIFYLFRNVTDNCGGETPEQMLIYDDNGKKGNEIDSYDGRDNLKSHQLFLRYDLIYFITGPCPELISHSSLMHGKHILSTPDVNHLFHIFTALNKKFVDGSSHNALDVEFLVLKNPQREIVILQSRPFKVHYHY